MNTKYFVQGFKIHRMSQKCKYHINRGKTVFSLRALLRIVHHFGKCHWWQCYLRFFKGIYNAPATAWIYYVLRFLCLLELSQCSIYVLKYNTIIHYFPVFLLFLLGNIKIKLCRFYIYISYKFHFRDHYKILLENGGNRSYFTNTDTKSKRNILKMITYRPKIN